LTLLTTTRHRFRSNPHPLFLFDRFTVQPVLIRTSHPSGSRRLCCKRNA